LASERCLKRFRQFIKVCGDVHLAPPDTKPSRLSLRAVRYEPHNGLARLADNHLLAGHRAFDELREFALGLVNVGGDHGLSLAKSFPACNSVCQAALVSAKPGDSLRRLSGRR